MTDDVLQHGLPKTRVGAVVLLCRCMPSCIFT